MITLSPSSPRARWSVLVLVATVMMAGYIFWDIVSPLATELKTPIARGGMGWTLTEYGFYAGSYSIFNIFLLMLFLGGIILDRCGIRFTGLLATGCMLVGAAVNWYAVSHIAPTLYTDVPFTLMGLIPSHLKLQVLVAAVGFGLFGMGCDITGITVSKVITRWFTGYELASAMGVQVALARLGTASALGISPLIAQTWGISAPLLAGTAVLLVAFGLFVAYCCIRPATTSEPTLRSSAADETEPHTHTPAGPDTAQRWGPIVAAFCLLTLLCLFFYASVRPFMKFATDLLVSRYDVSATTAGWIVSAIPYGSIVLTPLFGSLYDRLGHGIGLMATGCALLAGCHLCLALAPVSAPWFALAIMVMVGIAFSLVPSALWPSVPRIVPLRRLGTAYSLIYFIQNIGLMLVPIWIGRVATADTSVLGITDYTRSELIFALFALLALLTTYLLYLLDRRHHYGLGARRA